MDISTYLDATITLRLPPRQGSAWSSNEDLPPGSRTKLPRLLRITSLRTTSLRIISLRVCNNFAANDSLVTNKNLATKDLATSLRHLRLLHPGNCSDIPCDRTLSPSWCGVTVEISKSASNLRWLNWPLAFERLWKIVLDEGSPTVRNLRERLRSSFVTTYVLCMAGIYPLRKEVQETLQSLKADPTLYLTVYLPLHFDLK